MLLEDAIPFDIAMVNYRAREESDREEAHAVALAKKYEIKSFVTRAPKFEAHFEAKARAFRYDFFEEIVETHQYDNLLTAHQLNDQLEWLLMRLSKGAGVSELLGLTETSQRTTSGGYTYQLLRPLLDKTKEELLHYLKQHNHPYFIDKSNSDLHYERNTFRKTFSDPLIRKYANGIRKSFDYLQADKVTLQSGIKEIFSLHALRVLKLESPHLKSKAADLTLKKLGYLLSASQRKEIETHESVVIGGKWAVIYQNHRLYIAPFLTTVMPKEYKELCRVSSLPIKIRPYCYEKKIQPITIMNRQNKAENGNITKASCKQPSE